MIGNDWYQSSRSTPNFDKSAKMEHRIYNKNKNHILDRILRSKCNGINEAPMVYISFCESNNSEIIPFRIQKSLWRELVGIVCIRGY